MTPLPSAPLKSPISNPKSVGAPALLLQHFESLADTPDAVPKLRSLILDLAVRGRLVPSAGTPNDDPQWLKFCADLDDPDSGPGALPPPPFEAPGHWRWALLEEIAEPCGQKKPDAKFTYIDVGSIDNKRGVVTTDVQTLSPDEAPSRARKLVKLNSVIYSTVRPYLRNIAVIDRKFSPAPIVSTAFAVLHPAPFLNPSYLFYWLRSGPFQEEVETRMKGVAYPAISDSDFWECQIPVPPPEEQRRIVAKVEELLALCDQLEARQTTAREHRSRLVHSALDHLTAAKDEPDFRSRASFILHHSPFILEDVPALRQAILSLAGQGKLGTRNPGDEPVGELLKRVVAQKTQAASKIKSSSHLEPVEAESIPFARPNGWEWVQVQDLCNPLSLITYGILKPVWVENGVPTVRVQDMQGGRITVEAVAQCSRERAEKFTKTTLEEGDLLIAKDGATLGKTALVPAALAGGNITQHVLRFPISQHVFKPFVRLVIDSPHGQAWMRGETKGVALPGVNVGDFRRMPIPVPPLAEQKRIVSKVQQLMRWCDRLESELATARTAGAQLLDLATRSIRS